MREASNQIAREIFKAVEPLWKKQPNTIYAVRVVMPEFKHAINVFFEWNKIGKSTTSRAIKSYAANQQDEVLKAVDVLRRDYNLNVTVYN
ncbi:hypothetical protein R55210_AODCCCNP_00663 [Fructobacillus fructosus]|uniref:hypothetical protein n=1 Tax=Fructobacillus fructosus TaxID=1631 RepID=UPI002D9D1260|nr:hypothetical protein R55210_AODCCCNP_00663 [Fructobacillus fructosus]